MGMLGASQAQCLGVCRGVPEADENERQWQSWSDMLILIMKTLQGFGQWRVHGSSEALHFIDGDDDRTGHVRSGIEHHRPVMKFHQRGLGIRMDSVDST